MTLRLYNTLTRRKEEFRPLDAGNVRVYVCGPTVYDFAHIGNARPVVVFDVLFRLLRHVYPRVTYVRNITDVDDKINARAARDFPDLPLNEAIGRVTEGTLRQFHADIAALGCLEPTVEPRATGHIDDMKAMIERLVEKNCAYVAENHVLFHVAAMPDYGVLANRTLDEMLAGARVEVAPYKRDAMDFVLWKPSSPGEPAWASPCGIETPGRPGWHIECSAMSWRHLGETFDIHGGGIDLMFPHHENELAQSRCALGVERMASVWMHNGFLQVEGRKMAKSEGNFVTISELLQDWRGYAWPGEALRFNLLRTHYRQPMNWTYEGLEEAHGILWTWYGDLAGVKPAPTVPEPLISALMDDLNTAAAITVLHNLRREGDMEGLLSALNFMGFSGDLKKIRRAVVLELQRGTAHASGRELTVDATLRATEGPDVASFNVTKLSAEMIKELISARDEARKGKNFAEADRIRDELAAMGVELHDTKEKTTWKPKR